MFLYFCVQNFTTRFLKVCGIIVRFYMPSNDNGMFSANDIKFVTLLSVMHRMAIIVYNLTKLQKMRICLIKCIVSIYLNELYNLHDL